MTSIEGRSKAGAEVEVEVKVGWLSSRGFSMDRVVSFMLLSVQKTIAGYSRLESEGADVQSDRLIV